MLCRNSIKLNSSLRKEFRLEELRKWYSSEATASVNNPNEEALRTAKPFHEMPSPPLWPFIGSAWQFFPIIGHFKREKQHEVFREKRRLYGNVFRDKFGPLNFAMSYDAKDMETLMRNEGPYPERSTFNCFKAYRESRKQWYKSTGLLILQGKEWQDLRKKTQKHMLKPKVIQSYVGSMQDVAADFVQRMQRIKDPKNEVPNFLHELYKWSLESVAYVGLDARLGCFQDSESDGIKMINSVQTQFELLIKLEGFRGNVQLWKWFPTPTWRKYEKASDVFSEIAFKYINEACDKLKKMDENEDKELTMLQSMLATKDLDIGSAMVTAADMLFAGVDTTAHTAGFLLYELAKHPDKQELLHQEINKVLSSCGNKLTPAVLPELKYLKACLKESLRLHPIIPVGVRVLDHDVVISGYRVPSKTTIVVVLSELNRDERYFKDPLQFVPERWQNKDENANPFAYLPFGFGPRSCIGRRIAELEIMCLITEVIKTYKVEYHYEDIDIITKFVVTPDKPLKFSFIERKPELEGV